MIILLSFSPEELQQIPAAEMEELLSEIGRSSRRGHHIFVLARSLARFAAQLNCLGDLHRAEFKRLLEDATQNFSLLSSTTGYVEMSIGDQLQAVGHERKWIVGHKRALDGNLLSKPQLILEDAHSDGEVYRKVLNEGTAVGRGFKIQFEACHGGGSQTFRRLREQISAGSVSVSICDHDMRAPGSSRSETYNQTRTESERQDFVGRFFSPPYRELENLIPLRILRDCYPEVSPKKLDTLVQLLESQGEVPPGDCLWLYFDVKEGIEGEKLLQKCPSEESQVWLNSKFVGGDIKCVKDISFPGFGNNAVNSLLQSGPALKEFHLYLRSKYWKHHIQPFFEQVAWFLVGAKKARL